MELLFGYPAVVLGLAVGYLTARRGWPVSPLLAAGALVFAALAFQQSTVPDLPQGERGPITAPLWAGLGVVNAGSWMFGVAIGVATAGATRRRRLPPIG